MFEPDRKPQEYLLKEKKGAYILCKKGKDGVFNHNGASYEFKSLLYRLETAAKQGDTVVAEEGNEGLASLVSNFARQLDDIRGKKMLQAIEQGRYIHKPESAPQKPA